MGDVAVLPRTMLSLFSGIGALDLAIGRVFPDARTLCYVEREAYTVAVLAARMEDGSLAAAPVWSDIRTLPTDDLRGRVDLVAGGFPCQDISLAGDGAGIHGERSGLFFDLARVVRDVRPRYVFLENVAALTVRGIDAVLGTLADLGLDAEWSCLRASDVGAPHGRNRWWCLAWDREQLADSDGPRLHVNGQQNGWPERSELETPRRRDAGGCRAPVADANGRGFGTGRLPQRHDDAASKVDHLGDAAVIGRREGRSESAVRSRRHAVACPGRVSFPPGLDDRDGWRAYLAAYPDLAPAIESTVCRGADGASTRVDRLRGLGNAVVPAQAEAALRLLWHRAFGEMLP